VKRVSPIWVGILALVWWLLAAPRLDGWWAGVLAVALGTGLHLALGGRQTRGVRLRHLAAFIPWFLVQSARGGADVARRAMAPSLPLAPGFLSYPIRLPEGPARIFFVNCISLLPGTFSARLQGSELTVHHLAEPDAGHRRLADLEDRVGGLFGMELRGGGTR